MARKKKPHTDTHPPVPGGFQVVAYRGDFPMSGQPNFGALFNNLDTAIQAALDRWRWVVRTEGRRYAHARQNECCVLVLKDWVEDDPLFVIGCPGEAMGCRWE